MSAVKNATHLKVKNEKITHLKTADPRAIKRKPSVTAATDPSVKHRLQLQKIGNKIYATKNVDELLINLKDEITSFFDSERITIYVFDGIKRELVSRIKSGDEISEIRIPVSPNSIAGFAAHRQKLINIKNVYDDSELKAMDPALKFDKSWDQKTGFRTRQVLALPIFFQKYLMGAMQLINRKNGNPYSKADEKAASELAKMIGIALYNQKRTARLANNKFNYLLQNHILTPKELNKAIADAEKKKVPVENYLLEELKIPKKELGESLAKYYEVPFVEYNEKAPAPTELIKGVKVPFMKKNLWVPLKSDNGKIIVAVDDPQNFQKVGVIKSVFPNMALEFNVALKQDIMNFIDLFTGKKKKPVEPTDFDIDQISDELLKGVDEDWDEEESELVSEESSAVVKLVNKIIIDSYNQNVSDIHVEPQPGKDPIIVRTRIDGACQLYPMNIPFTYKNAIASRIKIMSGLDIAERRKPQDGKIQFKKYGGVDIELRVATIPTQGGQEDIVMRILAAGEPIPLANMGFSKSNFDNFVSIITQPYGIIFVCGPTGSGKTTTLHSALKYINKTEVKIWTAEDPVEITQKGLRQVQVQPKIGFDFAAAMRAFLRADPDIIMVGEMRDKETTSIGIEASLTGHLVFSTLHTNSAPESITRLLDMGMDPFNFADAVLGILAQRLVRTLCKKCKREYHPTQKEFDELVREYGGQEAFEKNQPVGMDGNPVKYTDSLVINKAEGCEKCNQTGYAGRMGIHELLMGSTEIKKLIQTQARVEEIRNQALEEGMRTLKQDGIEKVFLGYTDLLQVKKVCIS